MSDSFLRIGPFSRASSLSIKSLRAYHEQGLLVPAEVDPATGYRVYAPSQLLDAVILRRLRDLDVPLRQIREVLEARDPAVTENVLAKHSELMEQRLDETLRIIGGLQRGVNLPTLHTPVHLRDEPARHAVMRPGRVEPDGFAQFLDESFAQLSRLIDRSGARAVDVPTLLSPQALNDEDGDDVVALIAVEAPIDVPRHSGMQLGVVPATRVAVATHLGGYESLGDTYLALGQWVAEHAEIRPLELRERYVVGPPAPNAELCTEIHWPVM